LQGQVLAIADGLAQQAQVCSVLLLGSASRGELVTARVDGRLEVFGDIELLAVTTGRLPSVARRGLAEQVHEQGVALGYRSQLFHAEVLFRERSRLGRMPPLVFTHELAANGVVLSGIDVRAELRTVTIDSLDRKNTHEIAFKRLWALAEAIPEAWVKDQPMGRIDATSLAVACARNALDVPTVLLPEAGLLGASYAERVSMWRASSALPFRSGIDRALGEDSGSYFESCLQSRRDARPDVDPVRAHRLAVGALIATLGWLLHPGFASTAERTLELIRLYSGDIFNERPIAAGEVLGRLRALPRVLSDDGPAGAAAWLRSNKKGRLAASAGFLHLALASWMAGDEVEARRQLVRARREVEVRRQDHASATAPFADLWLDCRVGLARAFWHTVRLADPLARRRIEEALGRSW
jgi:hypothetical protein